MNVQRRRADVPLRRITPENSQGEYYLTDVVEVLHDRPGTQHVIITGRDAAPELLDAADLVTEMTKVKHPMDAGQKGQRGIEW